MSTPMTIAEPFNPNGGEQGGFPIYDHVFDIDTYASIFAGVGNGAIRDVSVFERWVTEVGDGAIASIKSRTGGAGAVAKGPAQRLPPEMASFARITMLPEVNSGGVVQWPGIPPEALRKIVRENLIPQVILQLRVGDVLKYSKLSRYPWKPGWTVSLKVPDATPSKSDREDIIAAQNFILNCSMNAKNARERDKKSFTDFGTFLSQLVRDSLTYDGMAIWTDRDAEGDVRSFKAFSAFNIRLCGPTGYKGDENVFAVAVDEAYQVINSFTREQFTFYVRNARADPDIAGYGYPEIEMAIRLIQAFQNALDLNADVFNRNSIPNGFLTVTGMWNQRQLDVLSRIWQNLKRGVSKSWAMPVIPVPKDGEIKVLDLSRLKEGDAYYPDFMNMLAGLFCSVYRFPVQRLGYHISGKNRDNEPSVPSTMTPAVEDYDPFLSVLLGHIEDLINQYLMDRWPQLTFAFTGASPKEDARLYEARMLAATVDERRAMQDQVPLEELATDEDEKKIARLMGQAPVDPGLSGIYQAIVSAVMAPSPEAGGSDGAAFPAKKDPARAQQHGHAAGVRRDSAAEKS